MHSTVTVFCLGALVTGLLMMVRIDTPFWERNPYLLSQSTWGWIYVLHGLAALIFVSVIMLHVYFALRPEKLFYTRSMILGWITRKELEDNHDPDLWKDAGDHSV
jgi:cytochrome b subunit of formate dehydrogenase